MDNIDTKLRLSEKKTDLPLHVIKFYLKSRKIDCIILYYISFRIIYNVYI